MLRRRSILASSAALAAGCGTAGKPLSLPSVRRVAAINVVASTIYGYLYTPIDGCSYRDSPESKFQRAVAALAEDSDDPYGPARGGYRLALRFYDDTLPRIERVPESLEEYEAAEARALKAVGELLDSLAADLVVVEPLEALRLGRNGLLLPGRSTRRRHMQRCAVSHALCRRRRPYPRVERRLRGWRRPTRTSARQRLPRCSTQWNTAANCRGSGCPSSSSKN